MIGPYQAKPNWKGDQDREGWQGTNHGPQRFPDTRPRRQPQGASFHRGIVRAAHEVAPEWMGCESFDLARIPYFNQDLEDEGIPKPVKELREKISAYDAVLIATPEYDYAIPGVLTAPWTGRCARATIPRPSATSRSGSWGQAREAVGLPRVRWS